MIVGFIVNKFRGDPSLFDERHARHRSSARGWRAFGLVPFFAAARAPAGRRRVRPRRSRSARGEGARDDRRADAGAHRQFRRFRSAAARAGRAAGDRAARRAAARDADLVILPGTKATIADLAFLREQGWDIDIARACAARRARARHLRRLSDAGPHASPTRDGIEGPPGEVAGLGLLDVATVLTGDKSLTAVDGVCLANGAPFAGYEMHVGRTTGPDCARPLLRFADGRLDGAISPDGRIAGAYVHGLFADDASARPGSRCSARRSELAYEATVERDARRARRPSCGASRSRRAAQRSRDERPATAERPAACDARRPADRAAAPRRMSAGVRARAGPRP